MTNETKQTAVEQLFIEMLEIQQSGKTLTFDENVELLNKYKEMEKERMIEFAEDWYFNGPLLGEGIDVKNTIEEHFNKTYGGGEQ